MEFINNALIAYPLLTLVLPLFLFCLFLYKWLTQTATRSTNLPPSPRGLPIIGNLHQLTTRAHLGLHALSLVHGDTMLLHLGSKRVLVVSSPTSASHVMKTHDVAFASRPSNSVFQRLLYGGKDIAGAPYGEHWRQTRSVSVLHLLSNSRVRSYSEVRRSVVSSVVEKMEGLVGTDVDLSVVAMDLSNDVISRVALGKKYGEKSELRRMLAEFEELLAGFYVGDYIPWLKWVNRVGGLDQRLNRIKEELDEFLEGVIREHEERRRDEVDVVDDGSAKDFVDVLLEVQRDEATGFALERDSIKGIILVRVLGHLFSWDRNDFRCAKWAMSELLRHPRSMKALQAEVRRIIRPDHPLVEEDLDQLKYLKATFKESMRLHPPVPLLLPRESTRDVELNWYTIPAGTRLILNVWAIQRDPTHWIEPDEFRPERFLDSLVDYKGQDFELIPFGAGRRGCPGISFAMASIELALASLVGRFDWDLPGNAKAESLDMEEDFALSVHMKNHLMAVPSLPIS